MAAVAAEPDQLALESDLSGGAFRIGVLEGRWAVAEPPLIADSFVWPRVVFWVQAAPRPNGPDGFYFCFDFANYPIDPPTGTFWDATSHQALALEKRPKGTGRVAGVFRTDWENARALYHPYDRVAASSHPQWSEQHPQKRWTRDHTVVNLLTEIHGLLHSLEYTHV